MLLPSANRADESTVIQERLFRPSWVLFKQLGFIKRLGPQDPLTGSLVGVGGAGGRAW